MWYMYVIGVLLYEVSQVTQTAMPKMRLPMGNPSQSFEQCLLVRVLDSSGDICFDKEYPIQVGNLNWTQYSGNVRLLIQNSVSDLCTSGQAV